MLAKKPTPKERVIKAIKGGASTQVEIRRVTGLPEDELCDVLAMLWDEEMLDRFAIRQRIYIAA